MLPVGAKIEEEPVAETMTEPVAEAAEEPQRAPTESEPSNVDA